MLKFHHLNLCSSNTPAMDDFYRKVCGLMPVPGLPENRVGLKEYGGHTTYVTDGAAQFHLSEKDHLVGFRTGHPINPLDRGHIAFRTDDIDRFKRHLTELGVPFSDYGAWAMNGWHQVFFFDPAGNVVEAHQDKS